MVSRYTATEGPVRTSRPGLLDLLGRAKWDAWKKRESLTASQAKEHYVETLLNILKSFKDRTQAVELLNELKEFGKEWERMRETRRKSRRAGKYSSKGKGRARSEEDRLADVSRMVLSGKSCNSPAPDASHAVPNEFASVS